MKNRFRSELGMRVGALGFFVALVGAALAFTILPGAGKIIAYVGIFVGVIGVVLHFIFNWEEIFKP